MNIKPTIYYVAGKSGGHIIPALTHARIWAFEHPDAVIGIFSTDAPLDMQLMSRTAVIKRHVPLAIGSLSRSRLWHIPAFCLRLLGAFWQSFTELRQARPEKVVSMGGYVSVPVCLAARCLGIPYELFELNVQPGAAIKFLTRGARTIYVCFEQAQLFFPRHKTVLVPYPLRFDVGDKLDREVACAKLQLMPERKTLFISGGSQGSHRLNELMGSWAEHMPQKFFRSWQVIHQTGSESEVARMEKIYAEKGIPCAVFAYRDDIEVCLSAADFVVTRAGAGALHEIFFFDKPALILPLENSTTIHQVANAQAAVAKNPLRWSMVRQADVIHRPEVWHMHLMRRLQE
jgi:UDP-N-acetylglucosamine--N-acetylmuramyl-(pentapeptide) pyrophosphoryl-undecaprenol N-acetylglucosamine transferase